MRPRFSLPRFARLLLLAAAAQGCAHAVVPPTTASSSSPAPAYVAPATAQRAPAVAQSAPATTQGRYASPYLASGVLADWDAQRAAGQAAGAAAGDLAAKASSKAIDQAASHVPYVGSLLAAGAKRAVEQKTAQAVTQAIAGNLTADRWFSAPCDLVNHLKLSHSTRPDFPKAREMVFQVYPDVAASWDSCPMSTGMPAPLVSPTTGTAVVAAAPASSTGLPPVLPEVMSIPAQYRQCTSKGEGLRAKAIARFPEMPSSPPSTWRSQDVGNQVLRSHYVLAEARCLALSDPQAAWGLVDDTRRRLEAAASTNKGPYPHMAQGILMQLPVRPQ